MAYNDILKNLVESLPEIHGSFIYNEEKGIISSHERTATNTIQKTNIGKHLSNILSSMNRLYSDLNFVRVNYRKKAVIGGQFHDNEFLLVLCDKDTPPGMTQMTMTMALNKLNETVDAPPFEDETVVEQTSVSPDDLLTDGSELSKILFQIKEELTKIIGPVADILFEDALSEWLGQADPSAENLSTLIQILTGAMDDDADAEKFNVIANNLK